MEDEENGADPPIGIWRKIFQIVWRQNSSGDRREPLGRSIRRLSISLRRSISHDDTITQDGVSKSRRKKKKNKVDTSPFHNMKKQRELFEAAECLSGKGFNVDDNEVNRRAGHVAAVHGSRVLVWGGYASGRDDDPWDDGRHRYWRTDWFMVQDTITGIWRALKTDSENCPPLTSGATAVVVGDTFYVFCGHAIRFFEDHALPTISLNKKEGPHPLLIVVDDLLVTEANTNEAYACDLTARPFPTWKRLNPTSRGMPLLPCDKLSSFVYDKKIYLFGGYGPQPEHDVHRNMPHTANWTMDHAQGNYHVPRGWNNQLVIYNPFTNEYTWPRVHGKPPTPRAAHTMAVDPAEGTAYLFGGRFGDCRTNELYELQLHDNKWTMIEGEPVDNMPVDTDQRPVGRSWHSFNVIKYPQFLNNNIECQNCSRCKIVLYGGYSNKEETLYDCWLLDPTKEDDDIECNTHHDVVTKRWTRLQHLELGQKFGRRMWHCGVTLPHGIMLIGGYGTNLPIYRPNVDHPSKVIELTTTPRTLYRLALDTACQVLSSEPFGIGSKEDNNKVSIDSEDEFEQLSELLPKPILKDIEKRTPKYKYDIALRELQDKGSPIVRY